MSHLTLHLKLHFAWHKVYVFANSRFVSMQVWRWNWKLKRWSRWLNEGAVWAVINSEVATTAAAKTRLLNIICFLVFSSNYAYYTWGKSFSFIFVSQKREALFHTSFAFRQSNIVFTSCQASWTDKNQNHFRQTFQTKAFSCICALKLNQILAAFYGWSRVWILLEDENWR